MKKIIGFLLVLVMILAICGCSNSKKADSKSGNATESSSAGLVAELQESEEESDVPDSMEEDSEVSEVSEEEGMSTDPVEDSEYDVDLTELSSTMVYSEVYNMMMEPDNYIGKKVRMAGQFALYQAVDENGELIPDQIYFACIIADATACCSQGMEFVLAGDYVYPDDYPEEGEEIIVSGTYETYEENGCLFCHLNNAVFE